MKESNKTLILLVGPSASGKTHLLTYLLSQGYQSLVSTTTRNSRPGEIQGIDYDFIDIYKSKEYERLEQFVELVEYSGVRYGVTTEQFFTKMEKGNGLVFLISTPDAINVYKEFCEIHGAALITIYIDTPPIVRFERLKQQAYKYIEELDYTGNTCEYYTESGVDRIIRSAVHESDWESKHDWDYVLSGERDPSFNCDLIKEYILKGL